MHILAARRIWLNDPCAVAMWPYTKLLRPLVIIIQTVTLHVFTVWSSIWCVWPAYLLITSDRISPRSFVKKILQQAHNFFCAVSPYKFTYLELFCCCFRSAARKWSDDVAVSKTLAGERWKFCDLVLRRLMSLTWKVDLRNSAAKLVQSKHRLLTGE